MWVCCMNAVLMYKIHLSFFVLFCFLLAAMCESEAFTRRWHNPSKRCSLFHSFACVIVLTACVSSVWTSPVRSKGTLWNTDLQRTELLTNEFPMPQEDRRQSQSMQGLTMLRPSQQEKLRQKNRSPSVLDSVRDVILHQYLGMVPAMQPETPSPQPHRVPSANSEGNSPRQSQQSQVGSQQNSSLPGVETCRLDTMVVTARRGGCKKRVAVKICHGLCNTSVVPARRPPFLHVRRTCCRPVHQEPVTVDMNDETCIRQRRKRRKARLTGYENVLLLNASGCECAVCV